MSTLIELRVPYHNVVSASLVSEVDRLQSVTAAEVATTPIVLALAASRARGLLSLIGLGQEVWAGEDAQEYVNRLRSEWR